MNVPDIIFAVSAALVIVFILRNHVPSKDFRILKLRVFFADLKWFAWFLCFYVAAILLTGYEAAMNQVSTSGAALSYGQLVGTQAMTYLSRSTNLFNEGVIGYSLLALIAVSVAMFIREMNGFHKNLRSLAHSEDMIEASVKPIGKLGTVN